jgi:hypothetical protein
MAKKKPKKKRAPLGPQLVLEHKGIRRVLGTVRTLTLHAETGEMNVRLGWLEPVLTGRLRVEGELDAPQRGMAVVISSPRGG